MMLFIVLIVNTIEIMSSPLVNLLPLFLGRLSPLLTSTCAHTLSSNCQLPFMNQWKGAVGGK